MPLPMDEMRDAVVRIAGTDFGLREQRWSSRFLSERRQARHYRVGRAFLAGDAAHVHSPLGGQGMNTGIQDAMNLGWKLAAAVQGRARPGLLDSYERERHPVGEQVLALTDAFNRLVLGRSAVGRAVRAQVIRALVRVGPVRRKLIGRLTGIGIAYPAERGAHAWVGRRSPDLAVADGRLYELLRDGRSCWSTGRTRACRSCPGRCGSCAVHATRGPGWCSSAPTATSPGPPTGRTSRARPRPWRAGAPAGSVSRPGTEGPLGHRPLPSGMCVCCWSRTRCRWRRWCGAGSSPRATRCR